MGENNRPATIYGVGLLDDLHNYFPDLLYNSNRFQTVSDVIYYVQTSTQQRFDLYSYGRSMYMRLGEQPMRSHVSQAVPVQPRRTPAATTTASREFNSTIPLYYQPARTESIDDTLDNSVRILTSLFSGFMPINVRSIDPLMTGQRAGNGSFLDAIIVSPSPEQIQNATTVEVLSSNSGELCSICQDEMMANDEVRKIRGCNHRFHRACIDAWFLRNTRCPICRLDIRDGVVRPAASPTVAAPVSPRSPPVVRHQRRNADSGAAAAAGGSDSAP